MWRDFVLVERLPGRSFPQREPAARAVPRLTEPAAPAVPRLAAGSLLALQRAVQLAL
jgi:hypothetical protein